MTKVRLSETQRQIVQYGEGPLLVVAGPGTGKTRVLTERVRHLLSEVMGHFRVLALTYTNKAANEMKERLKDLGDLRQRAFIGTLHGFCLEILTDRGKPIGVQGLPQIFEQAKDRKQILLEAALADPLLAQELADAGDVKDRDRRIEDWLRLIALIKAHPISRTGFENPLDERVVETYNAGLRACGAYDFDDLLLLAYRLLVEYPKIGDFYRRLYKFICVDEAQDLNEAQYAVIKALCGEDFRNVLMVGDPKQSIYGFNTSSSDYMYRFRDEFNANEIELTENYRSSRAVVKVAQSLVPKYMVQTQLPIGGDVQVIVGQTEEEEAKLVVDEIERLVETGHQDIEGPVTLASCAILGRTRYVLLVIERELKNRKLSFYKRLSSLHENESKVVEEFQLGLRLYANPKDRLHLAVLAEKWGRNTFDDKSSRTTQDVLVLLDGLAARNGGARCKAVVDALKGIDRHSQRLDLMPGLKVLRTYADGLTDDERRAVYEDTTVLEKEWDQYLRAGDSSSRAIAGFLSSMALGTTQQVKHDGVALLTVHSSKGLEYDVVFIVCMTEGVFPDYRTRGNVKSAAEEKRNAFVAVTRSRRLLYFSYPRQRCMPWGDTWQQKPSPYLRDAGLVG